MVAVTRRLSYPAIKVPGLIVGSVGLKVTSLRWIGPEPEGSEALPRVPDGIEYNDTVERAKDISIVDMADMADQNGMHIISTRNIYILLTEGSGSLLEATQDITERQKLQRMIPVRHSQERIIQQTLTDRKDTTIVVPR